MLCYHYLLLYCINYLKKNIYIYILFVKKKIRTYLPYILGHYMGNRYILCIFLSNL